MSAELAARRAVAGYKLPTLRGEEFAPIAESTDIALKAKGWIT